MRYHVNPDDGNVNVCKATIQECKYGGDFHSNTKEDAQKIYEQYMQKQVFNSGMFFTNDNTKMRKKYDVPEYMNFTKAYIQKKDYKSKQKIEGNFIDSYKTDIQETYNKDLNEVEKLIEDDPFNDYLYQDIHRKYLGLDFVKGLTTKEDLQISDLQQLNKELVGYGPEQIRNAGEFRQNNGIYVQLEDNNIFIPRNSKGLKEHTIKLVEDLNADFNKTNAVQKVSEYMTNFIASQPFDDGNKRTAAYFASAVLMKNGMKPLFLNKKGQDRLSVALDSAFMSNDIEPFQNFVSEVLSTDTYDYDNESMSEYLDY